MSENEIAVGRVVKIQDMGGVYFGKVVDESAMIDGDKWEWIVEWWLPDEHGVMQPPTRMGEDSDSLTVLPDYYEFLLP